MIGNVATRATQQAMRVGGRQLHGSAISRGAGGGGYDYLHAKYMYNFRNKPGSKLRVGGLIVLGVSTGVAIPCFAVWFNQRKAGLV